MGLHKKFKWLGPLLQNVIITSQFTQISVYASPLSNPEMDFSLLALSCTIFIGYLIFAVYRKLRQDPLRAIPGPPLARWSTLWLSAQARLGRRYLAVHAAHQKYGPVVRIAPNHISLAAKDAIPVVFGQGSRALAKSQFYDAFIGGSASVFSTRDRAEHARKRKGYSKTFAPQSVKDYSPLVQDCLKELIQQFDNACEVGAIVGPAELTKIDMLKWLNYFAFDVLSDLAFGHRLGMLRKGSDLICLPGSDVLPKDGCISLVDHREHLAAVIGLSPGLRWLSSWLPDPFFQKGRRSADGLLDVARACILERLQTPVSRDDILGKLLATRDKSQDREELISEAVTLLIAGSDTTSNSITAALYLLLKHPEVHKKLLYELESAFGIGSLPTSCDDCGDLVYLQNVINESLRVFAPTAIGLPRSVPHEGLGFSGHWFPADTELSVPSWTIQHDPAIWGKDVDEYRPERWSENPGLIKYLMTFGFGPRACLGRNLAYLEMKMVLATIILRYDFTLSSEALESTEGFMHKPRDLWVQIRRRHPETAQKV